MENQRYHSTVDGGTTGPIMAVQNDTRSLDFIPMTHRELLILRTIAIVAASLSLFSGLLVGYWFIRMKRSFRHHLIMLLICSDFWKASWQLIYPAVVLSNGKYSRAEPFCQINGFFLSMGIEASDFAILVIAVHSTLYIFRPGTRLGERGLYNYRFYLYWIWLAFPLLMASLAFVNGAAAYNAQGTYCYLPARPIWMRLVLAWIPRYLTLITILILYASIYIYVRIKFRNFKTKIGASFDLDELEAGSRLAQAGGAHRVLSLHCHGLIPLENSSQNNEERRQVSTISDESFMRPSGSNNGDHSPRVLTPSQIRSTDGIYDFTPSHSPSYAMMNSGIPQGADIIQQATASEELSKRRYAISRQLRLLFIYPLVYALMWVPPLISHSLQYTDYFASNNSFALQCLVSFTLPIQCAVDCWLFATREKPWKFIPHTGKRTFWFSFLFWKHDDCEDEEHDGPDHTCRQREEDEEEWKKEVWKNSNRRSLSIEQRAAYARREEERREAEQRLAEKRQGMSHELVGIPEEPSVGRGSMLSGKSSVPPGAKTPIKIGGGEWWDRVVIDDPDEEEDEEQGEDLEEEEKRGRRPHSEQFGTLEIRIGSSDDVTIREQSLGSVMSGKGGYQSGFASGSGSRSVSVSAATSTTKRDSGSVIEILDGACNGDKTPTPREPMPTTPPESRPEGKQSPAKED